MPVTPVTPTGSRLLHTAEALGLLHPRTDALRAAAGWRLLRHWPWPISNRRYSRLPVGATALPNSCLSADLKKLVFYGGDD